MNTSEKPDIVDPTIRTSKQAWLGKDDPVVERVIRRACALAGDHPFEHTEQLQVVRYVIIPHLKPAIVIMTLMSTFWTFNNFVYVWLTTGAGPGLYTNVMATEVYIKAFIDGRFGYSSAVGIVMAAIMVAFGMVYLRYIAQRELKEVF